MIAQQTTDINLDKISKIFHIVEVSQAHTLEQQQSVHAHKCCTKVVVFRLLLTPLILFIVTGAHSNDPKHRICNEVKCLHEKSRNTFAIGIGNINQTELNCMANTTVDNYFNIFNFRSFTEFENALADAILIINTLDNLHGNSTFL